MGRKGLVKLVKPKGGERYMRRHLQAKRRKFFKNRILVIYCLSD
jgi:hypothetical protein